MIERARAAIVGRPASLPVELAREWPELREARYRRGGLPPRIGGWCLGARTVAAITLRRTVWLADAPVWDVALLLHELRHVHQFAATRGFPLRYVWESMRRGYRANRFEVDARAFAARRLQEAAAPPLSEDV
jgi:hypothetical protein